MPFKNFNRPISEQIGCSDGPLACVENSICVTIVLRFVLLFVPENVSSSICVRISFMCFLLFSRVMGTFLCLAYT